MSDNKFSSHDQTYFDQFDTELINQQDKDHFLHPFQVFDAFTEEGALPIAAFYNQTVSNPQYCQ